MALDMNRRFFALFAQYIIFVFAVYYVLVCYAESSKGIFRPSPLSDVYLSLTQFLYFSSAKNPPFPPIVGHALHHFPVNAGSIPLSPKMCITGRRRIRTNDSIHYA